MKEIIFKTKNLSKNYGNKIILDNINMTIKQGDIYGLVGKNGAGKTTLIKIALSLIEPNKGDFELFGNVSRKEQIDSHRKIGSIVETPTFYPYLSARENLEYYRVQRGIPGKECIDEVLKLVDLHEVGKKKAKKFSLGMKQRLGIALAMMGNPDFLILDEPINGLDPMGIKEVREILLRINKMKNTTILISSHILLELSQLANCYGFINEGKLIEEISSEELLDKCKRCLYIKVDKAHEASVILENEFKCKNYEVLNDNYIKIYEHLEEPHIINKTFSDNGIMVYSLDKLGINLEDYFLKLIGGKKDA